MSTNRLLTITKNILWMITGCGLVAGISRLIFGLGATTALTDITPWGLWVGFDVLGGVALAAGGFIISGMVYILHLQEFKPLLRSTVLTAFLGYLAVITGLTIDLGRPWKIWSPTINWQIRSALFEVAWCVMLYTIVLALEFAPVVVEKFPRLAYLLNPLKKITIPLVILGIMLSSMHQSTLGTIFVLFPFRVDPLWYTSWLPLLFFASAIALGLAMVIGESLISGWLFGRELEHSLLQRVAGLLKYALIFYLALVLANLTFHGKLALLFSGSGISIIYWVEILISTVVPIILLSFSSVVSSTMGLGASAASVATGFVLNRLNLAIFSMVPITGYSYFPSGMEIAISCGILSGAILIFFFFVENFKVYEPPPLKESADDDLSPPVFDRSTEVWLGPRLIRRTAIHLFYFSLGASLSFAFLPQSALEGALPQKTIVSPPRGLNPMIIDGNRNRQIVLFDHDRHIRDQGREKSCLQCHHMLKPWDEGTSCSECHQDMFLKILIFNHSLHETKHEGNKGCQKCHKENEPKTPENIKVCTECHTTMLVKGSRIQPQAKGPDRFKFAVGYKDAMHGLCLNCHQEKAKEYQQRREAGEPLISRAGVPLSKEEWISKERLHFCFTCHREVKYTKDPIPMIIQPQREVKRDSIPLFLTSRSGEVKNEIP